MSFSPSTLEPSHFLWDFADGVATITLNRPERKNPLTFESYDELRSTFWSLDNCREVKAVVMAGAGGNFCSGGDVHEIIGPLTKMDEGGLLRFTRMTGDLVRAMRACPQPIIAAVEGVCAGAGAIIAMASDLRLASPEAKTAFLFTRVGLSGADMGACAILPRLIGHSRALDLILTGRAVAADEALQIGLANRVVADGEALSAALELAAQLCRFPQQCLRSDRLSAYEQWDLALPEALHNEFTRGLSVIASRETVAGATRFVSGQGRHGAFD